MRNLIFFMHTSLDGFVAGLKGEMNWINVNEEMFDFVATMTDKADAALYGRITYEMMENYWPTAGEHPNASKHDKEHSAWYNKVSKIVLSKTLSEKGLVNTTVISDQLEDKINKIKKQDGKNILMQSTQSLQGKGCQSVDEYGQGILETSRLWLRQIIIGERQAHRH